MKWKNKCTALATALMLALSLTACSNNTVAESSSTVPSPSSTVPSSSSTPKESNSPESTQTPAYSTDTEEEEAMLPTVYMTKDISPEGLMAIYNTLGRKPQGNVAVKISTGEPGSHYLDANLIADLVQDVNGSIVECNTAYGGNRASTAFHLQLAADHGYTAIADVDIMDANGSVSLPVEGGSWLTENLVGRKL